MCVLLTFVFLFYVFFFRTYFPEAKQTVRLEYGEFLLHPGTCVHGGVNITRGTRFIMVTFANEKK